MGCGKSRDFPADPPPADSRRPRPSRVSRAKLDLDDDKSSPNLPLSKKSGRVPYNSGCSCTGDDHEAVASTSHTLTPAVTPHGDTAATVAHRRSESRGGGRSPKGRRRRGLDSHDRASEAASCSSTPSTRERSEYRGLGEEVGGKENEIPSAAMADRVRTTATGLFGDQPQK